MTEHEATYRASLESVVMAARLVSQWDLPELLKAMGRAQAIGPLVDPTLYRAKAAAMEQDRELLEAALPLWRFAREHLQKESAG